MTIFRPPNEKYIQKLFEHSDSLIERSNRAIRQMAHAIDAKLSADRMVELQRAEWDRMKKAFAKMGQKLD